MGTIIASLASVISYKLYIKENPESNRRYLFKFSIYNLISLVVFTFIGYFIVVYKWKQSIYPPNNKLIHYTKYKDCFVYYFQFWLQRLPYPSHQLGKRSCGVFLLWLVRFQLLTSYFNDGLFILAHRLSTIINTNRIFIVDNIRILE